MCLSLCSFDKERGRVTAENRNEKLRWILGVSLKDKKNNEVIRKTLGVACITDKIREARLYGGHVMRREDENSMKRVRRQRSTDAAVEDKRRSDEET